MNIKDELFNYFIKKYILQKDYFNISKFNENSFCFFINYFENKDSENKEIILLMYFSIFNEKKISEISVDKLLKEVNEYSKDEIEKMKLLSFILGLFIKNNLEKESLKILEKNINEENYDLFFKELINYNSARIISSYLNYIRENNLNLYLKTIVFEKIGILLIKTNILEILDEDIINDICYSFKSEKFYKKFETFLNYRIEEKRSYEIFLKYFIFNEDKKISLLNFFMIDLKYYFLYLFSKSFRKIDNEISKKLQLDYF